MKIILAEHFGMCFGVRDALAAAEAQTAAGPLTILGELVHNPLVINRLQASGALQGRLDSLESAPTGRVLITAHGAADERRRAWQAAGFEVTDTTCPLVRRAHARLAALVAAGYFPVVIGTAGHAEVRGLTGDFSRGGRRRGRGRPSPCCPVGIVTGSFRRPLNPSNGCSGWWTLCGG